MDCAGSARYLLAVATIAMAISLGCAAPLFGVTLSSQRDTSDSASTSLLSKLPIPLPKISSIINTVRHRSPQPSETNAPTSPDNKQQDSQQLPQQQPNQSPPKPTVDEQPDKKDPYQSLENASVTTSPRTKLETSTEDRSNIELPLFSCGPDEKFNHDRECVKKSERFSNPEDE